MRYIDADKLKADIKEVADTTDGKLTEFEVFGILSGQPTADVIEIGKPYFYEEGYVLKDFHNDGVHRYFVIERVEE